MEAGTKNFTEGGNGNIDFGRIFAAREKAGLKYWFVEQDQTKGDPFDSLKMSHDYLAKNFLRNKFLPKGWIVFFPCMAAKR
jgi:sugar phosphate isomerase/epimerase